MESKSLTKAAEEALREQFNSGQTEDDRKAFRKYYHEVLFPAFVKDFLETQPLSTDLLKIYEAIRS